MYTRYTPSPFTVGVPITASMGCQSSFRVDIECRVVFRNDVVQNTDGGFLDEKLSEGLQDFIPKPFVAKWDCNLDIYQVVAWDGLLQV